ncbi:MAG TPA: BON domain-containing protein [Blastocatellia bacterium]|nr:BON domain-containing protein [Blastocatellia bacterium]
MAEYHERRTIIENEPDRRTGQIETEHEHVSYVRRGMSGAAVAAIVLSAVAAAVLLTLLFTSDRSESRDAEVAEQRVEPIQAVPAQQPPPPQPPVVVTVPPPQTQTVPVPVPVPAPAPPAAQSQPTPPAVTDTSIEVDIISKLTSDPELRSQAINVKFNNGTATLSGLVPRASLKARAEVVASSIKGVTRVVNEIAVQGQ